MQQQFPSSTACWPQPDPVRISRWTFAACRITALAAFLLEVAMPNIDFRGIVIVCMLLGVALGGVIAGAVVLAWPHVWDWIKPLLHAATA